MSFATEFPDFPASDFPAMPQGFRDCSWHNDACPSMIAEPRGIIVYVDYSDGARREHEGGKRFVVFDPMSCEDAETAFESDDWNEVLTFIKRAM
jgi:hypothetical protein